MAEKITQKVVDNLVPPAEGNTILYDTEVRGFGVRVTSSGVRSYILNYRINGRERRYTIGRCEEWSVTGARGKAEAVRGDIAKGNDPLQEKERLREAAALQHGLPRVNELAREYLASEETQKKRPHTLYDYKAMIDGILTPQLGNRKVAEIQREDLSRLHASLKATPYKANRLLALTSAMFSFAIEDKKWRADNPAKGIERFQEDKREYWLDGKELQAVLAAVEKHQDQLSANAVRLMMLTGARKSEVLSATWSQFDLAHGTWTKPSHHTKAKRIERVPLGADALRLLGTMKNEGEYLFPGKRPNTHLSDLKQFWKEIRNAAKVPRCRIHDLRHTYASHLVSKGESLHVVGKLLGHTQPQTTARYAHLSDEALRDATNRVGRILRFTKKASRASV